LQHTRLVSFLSIACCLFIGTLVGSGGYTFVTAAGTSYLSDDPKACVNCHVMRDQFDGWQHGSHHASASCNDCHLPHESVLRKLLVKAQNGYHHSRAFTLQSFHEPIQIKPGNAAVLERNCLRCHQTLTSEITAHGTLGTAVNGLQGADLYGCTRCHSQVGHGARH
jgi:cytochrome c nitrite reductase small subunit